MRDSRLLSLWFADYSLFATVIQPFNLVCSVESISKALDRRCHISIQVWSVQHVIYAANLVVFCCILSTSDLQQRAEVIPSVSIKFSVHFAEDISIPQASPTFKNRISPYPITGNLSDLPLADLLIGRLEREIRERDQRDVFCFRLSGLIAKGERCVSCKVGDLFGRSSQSASDVAKTSEDGKVGQSCRDSHSSPLNGIEWEKLHGSTGRGNLESTLQLDWNHITLNSSGPSRFPLPVESNVIIPIKQGIDGKICKIDKFPLLAHAKKDGALLTGSFILTDLWFVEAYQLMYDLQQRAEVNPSVILSLHQPLCPLC